MTHGEYFVIMFDAWLLGIIILAIADLWYCRKLKKQKEAKKDKK